MISSSFAVFAFLSKVKSAALQKMKPGLLSADPTKSNNVFSCLQIGLGLTLFWLMVPTIQKCSSVSVSSFFVFY